MNNGSEFEFVKLAYFNPNCKDEYGNQVIDYLILDCLASFGQLHVEVSDIKGSIKRNFLSDFEDAEIIAAGRRLKTKGLIDIQEGADRFTNPTFQISSEAEKKIKQNLSEIVSLNDSVIEAWRLEVLEKYREFPAVVENIDSIIDALQTFTSKMLYRHGVECVALIYPEDPKAQQWLVEIGGSILDYLPKIDPFVDGVLKLEIPSFFKNPDADRKKYIVNLFNSSFFWRLIQVDEKCSGLLQKITAGQRLFLDNNILYCLIGLNGASVLQSVHSMLRIAHNLGYELWVTSKTIEEFHESLEWQMNEFRKKPPLPAELADIAVKKLGTDSFLTLYWSDFVKSGIKIDQFVSERSHLEEILAGLNIKITNEFRKEIDNSEELLDEESILRETCGNLSQHIIEHDAFHRVLINKIRTTPKYHFSDAQAWFLTQDRKLPVYDRAARRGKGYLPFCITSDQWVQINRPLLARTADEREYEESFHILVTQPFIRTLLSSFSYESVYNEILGKLARYKNMNPRLALSIITDTHFMITISSETDEDIIQEEIENKVVEKANELQKRVDVQENQISKLDKDIINVSAEVKSMRDDHSLEISAIRRELDDEKGLRQTAEKAKDDEKELRIDAEKKKDAARKKYRLLVRGVVLFVIFLVISGLSWYHENIFAWPALDLHNNKLLMEIIWQLILICLLTGAISRKNREWWLIGGCIPLIILILTFFSK